MAFSFLFRPRQVVLIAAPETPPRPSVAARLGASFQVLWRVVAWVFTALDRAFVWLAVPFGVRVRDPVRRYAMLLGLFAVLFVLGALPVPLVALPALAAGYVGMLAIGRAWVRNEEERTAIVKQLEDADPDQLPDLRWTALVSALLLLILFPLAFQQAEGFFHL